MKSNVEELAPYADQTTLQLLNFVIDKKRKFDVAKKRQLELVLAWFCLTIIYTVYVVKTLLLPYRYSFLDLFNQLMTNQLSTFGLLAILFCLFAFKLLKEQKEKKEKEYHDLRKEIVDRSKDLWKEQRWNDRHIVFEHMKKNYDINLYHESK